jgi:hypothetical protein
MTAMPAKLSSRFGMDAWIIRCSSSAIDGPTWHVVG